MQSFSDILPLRDAVLDCLHGQIVFTEVFQGLANSMSGEIALVAIFCAGFMLFRATFVRKFASLLIRHRGDSKVLAKKLDAEFDVPQDAEFTRPRCATLCAQTAGQPPPWPHASTTAILQHIPKSLTPDELLASLHEEGYFGTIDFLYVPIDFKRSDRSLGFAILNFDNFSACSQFAAEYHMVSPAEKFPDHCKLKNKQLLEVSPAQIQGCQENIQHLRKSPVLSWLSPKPMWLPRFVDRGGMATPLRASASPSRPRRSKAKESPT